MPNGLDLGNVLFQAERIKGARAENQANLLAQQAGAQFRPLLQNWLANPQDPQARNALIQANPQLAQQVFAAESGALGVQEQQAGLDRETAQIRIGQFDGILRSKAPKRLLEVSFRPEQIQEFERESGESIADWDETETIQRISALRERILPFTGPDFLAQRTGGGATAGQREFASRVAGADLGAGELERANRIALGLEPRATGAAQKVFDVGGVPHMFDPNSGEAFPLTIRGAEVTTETVSESEATILAEKERAKGAVVLSNKVIDQAFSSIEKITGNIRNLDRAISALDRGAKTGAVRRFMPNIKAASVELGQIQKQLSLDIIGAVTFGALSQGELDLAMSTALPTGLNEPELKAWLIEKKAAQEKMIDYFSDQIAFLDSGGTVAGFRAQQTPGQAAPQDGSQPQEFATVEEAEAANLPVGTRVSIGGQLGTIQ